MTDEIEVKHRVEEMYWNLEDEERLYAFSTHLAKEGLYRHPLSFVCNAQRVIFNGLDRFSSRRAYRKYRRILEIFGEFKKEGK